MLETPWRQYKSVRISGWRLPGVGSSALVLALQALASL